jgi:hypothetical protein
MRHLHATVSRVYRELESQGTLGVPLGFFSNFLLARVFTMVPSELQSRAFTQAHHSDPAAAGFWQVKLSLAFQIAGGLYALLCC